MAIRILLILVTSYILGSIPFGLILVKLSTGKDLRQIESGRTGGTNAGRAAGFWIGFLTAFFDGLKAALTVWIARALTPNLIWMEVFAPLVAVIGHNYSVFLMERSTEGTFRLRGGAGGAPFVGGAFGIWPPSLAILVPIGALILYFVGYASVTTMSTALITTIVFTVRTLWFDAPWQYIAYGILGEMLLIWALRPNIHRLLSGNERLVGRRAKQLRQTPTSSSHSSSSSVSSSS
ncbi:MAG: glycerol-3-phosphate acyltransferase [Anaerolineales bacterium]|nr:glycerol-3-phosphate acyltransferase [Anaerolineales bacterium]MCS7248557.1 glycerol-3-phosphate acyltransferase [Anaerolineales bacterium]MDW8162370.1 glycerol-3-phosphate acyltransferase [Anaerolineales bacterium]MDW8448301.1 glycerol-3-phosphate acyltransferase [Anaerolineales bacterium]